MKILKSEHFISRLLLTNFVSDNKIAREDIISITAAGDVTVQGYTIFFYGEPEIDQKRAGFWG